MPSQELTLETDRLTLRFPTPSDAQQISQLANNLNIARMVARIKHPYSLDDAQKWLNVITYNHEALLHITFMMCLKNSKKIIGTCSASHTKQQSYELGYWVGEDYWNKGYASEAVKTLCDFLTKKREAKLITAWYANENIGSMRVLEKAGFVKTPQRDDIFSAGRNCLVPSSMMEIDLKRQR